MHTHSSVGLINPGKMYVRMCFDSKLLSMKAKGLMYVVPYRKLMACSGLIVLFFICSSKIDSVTSYSFL